MKWSLGSHLLLVLVILIKNFIFPDRIAYYVPTLKVDLVGLPDVLKKDLSNSDHHRQFNQEISKILKEQPKSKEKATESKPSKTSSKASHSASKDEMLLKPKHAANQHKDQHPEKGIEKKNLRALERIKALSKIQKSISDDVESTHRPSPVKGNKISPGTSLSGEAKEALVASYYDTLRDQLKDHWTLPPWIARQKFSAQVQLYLDSGGRVTQFAFRKTSGSSPFDEAVTHAIQESQPFPAPPKELADSLISDGILIGFPL